MTQITNLDEFLDLFQELSNLARETKGGSFIIQHNKSNGMVKVVFPNLVHTFSNKLKDTNMVDAILEAINFIKSNRVELEVPEQKYTLFKKLNYDYRY